MKQNKWHIEYPFTSFLLYKNQTPFIRIYKNDHVYYGIASKTIQFVELHQKNSLPILLFHFYEKPNSQHFFIFNQATKLLRGVSYQLLYVSNHQYFCIMTSHNIGITLLNFNIDLNTKGYYEIQDVQDIVEYLKSEEL